jgi:hypothetical protein
MYSKASMVKFIEALITSQGRTKKEIAESIGMTPSNFARVLEKEGYNFTLQQFGQLAVSLNLTQDQVFHLITGKKKKEAVSHAVAQAAENLVNQLK